MTREVAIDLLSMIEFEQAGCCLNTWYKGIDDDMKEALKMAIQALEQEPYEDEELDFVQSHKKIKVNLVSCEDAISRQEAIEAVRVGALSTAT